LENGEAFGAQQPIGRLIEPMEIAQSITWLCSPASSAITGADLAVDGGMTV
jgi:NAD(P)-dependent dehydrogenase (short-subunit alcohol dehydrogenase family)